ncbi:hypothetical protein H310_07854 [Aphanomyces invadans]|uniref:RCC1-like domain-containing protein n=1 Tax=Aphanomyces invadans TaxID=157072 RepID=A0A024U0M2_9STRA|nr:hypothetical protein H310_07854 [Aphanomyces invadans]ETV99813.1 hypothetical protein H310_07854 [Aphanomyces invadans]|eukprot:XP_008871589.1 hypothetical protein H310_07854 [Aphanomyces invadans]
MPGIYAWGSGSSGQLGTRDDLDYAEPVKVDFEAAFVGITTGGGHSAGWTTSGELFTWGDASRDRLGRATSSSPSLVAKPVLGLPPIDLACCGWWHTVAISQAQDSTDTSSSRPTQVYVWGHGHASKEALPLVAGDAQGTRSTCAKVLVTSFPSSICVTSLSCGWKHSLIATQDGRVFAWGKGRHGELAMGPTATEAMVPTRIESLAPQTIHRVFCGWQHSVFLTALGDVWTSGSNKHGQLGVPQVAHAFVPQRVQVLNTTDEAMVDVSVGWHHAVCLGRSGAVYGWGKGDLGQLGFGSFESKSTPQPLPVFAHPPATVCQVACGSEHTLFVMADGQVYSCGWGEHGNLGHGNIDNVATPTKIAFFQSRGVHVDRCIAGGAVSIALTH